MRILSDYTPARVQLGTAGGSLPTNPLLDLRLAHARAQDAVHFPLDSFSLVQEMAQRNWDSRVIRSSAKNRDEYLHMPDRGRMLDDASASEVARFVKCCSVALVVADGLSALAVHRHAVPLLQEAFQRGLELDEVGCIWIVHQGRVAVGDHIAELLQPELSIVIIGERPGLSTPDSLGIYLTWEPRLGRKDSERNCISNIHGHGLSYRYAADKLVFLITEARRRRLSGVLLKDLSAKQLTEE